MRPALAWLFENGDPELLRQSLRDQQSLDRLRSEINSAFDEPGGHAVPQGSRGANLLMALIALRLKFPRDVAEQKLETNLTLRRSV